MIAFKTVSVAAVLLWMQPIDRADASVDTWETGDLTPSSILFKRTSAIQSVCVPRNINVRGATTFTTLGRPIPTNSWWSNLLACQQKNDAPNNTSPIWSNPFALTLETGRDYDSLFGISMSYAFRNRYFGGASGNGNSVKFYGHAIWAEALFSATEFKTTKPTFELVDWSDLGVHAVVVIPAPAGSTRTPQLESYLVNGMAYLSAIYTDLTPKLYLQNPVATINGAWVTFGSIIIGNRLVIQTVNGDKWVLYALPAATQTTPLALRLDATQVLTSTSVFNGVLRIAPILTEVPVTVYDMYNSCMVTGATVSIPTETSYEFAWQMQGDCSNGLLQFALPHQVQTIDQSSAKLLAGVIAQSATRGTMQAVVTTSKWVLVESQAVSVPLYPITRPSAAAITQQKVLTTLSNEINGAWAFSPSMSIYSSGKAAQKYAQLCLMANDPKIVGASSTLLTTCVRSLEDALLPFLNNSWTFPLQYDRVFGGIVSSAGYVTGNLDADYGSSVYNDHHYHYGYWVYCAAVLNYLHPTWSRIGDLNTLVRAMLRDVATPNSVDPFFPKFRNFDWFRGHSYSHGLTPFGDGKDEESTSEDINFAYAMAQFGWATRNTRMATIGKAMARLTARSTQTYFLLENSNTVHPAQFRGNKVTGILFDNKVDYATWFSTAPNCIHGIQMVALTPMTQFVRTKTFIQEEWNQVLVKDPSVAKNDFSNPWLSLLYANYAAVNQGVALPILQKVALDDGLSRSWALYIALSRA